MSVGLWFDNVVPPRSDFTQFSRAAARVGAPCRVRRVCAQVARKNCRRKRRKHLKPHVIDTCNVWKAITASTHARTRAVRSAQDDHKLTCHNTITVPLVIGGEGSRLRDESNGAGGDSGAAESETNSAVSDVNSTESDVR